MKNALILLQGVFFITFVSLQFIYQSNMKGVYIFLADGFEITEALTTVNMLRRGGVDVRTVSIYDDKRVMSSNRIPVIADMAFGEFKASTTFGPCLLSDVMIFPGGMPGSSELASFDKLMKIMQEHYAEGGTVAAICAAPSVVLGLLPNLEGKKMTCYDGFEQALIDKGVNYCKEGVVVDGNIITGRGPGWALEFGLAILAHLKGAETAARVKKELML